MTTPRTVGRLPFQRMRPALPQLMFDCSALPTSPTVARQRTSTYRISPDGSRSWARLPSGEIRNVDVRCRASIGEVGNAEQSNINWGKAGRMRWKGKRPTVRGVVMNPVDHPHGGGEGKTSGGRHPVSPWGKPEGRTRKRKASDAQIIRRRRKHGKR